MKYEFENINLAEEILIAMEEEFLLE